MQQLEQTRGSQPTVDSHNLATNAQVEAVEKRVQALESKPTVDTSEFAKKSEVPTVDSVNDLVRIQGEQATKNFYFRK